MQVRIATIEEIKNWWDQKIKNKPDDPAYPIWKKDFVDGNKKENRKTFFAFDDNNNYIGQGTLYLKGKDKDLTGKGKAEIIKFEVNREHRGKGVCSAIYKKIVEYAKEIGITTLTIGVEPKETGNIQIYFHWGFTNYIKYTIETLPSRTPNGKEENYCVNYYYKEI